MQAHGGSEDDDTGTADLTLTLSASPALAMLRWVSAFTRDDHPSLYGVRLLFATVVAIYFLTSGPLSGALPMSLGLVIAALAVYAVSVALLWLCGPRLGSARRWAPLSHVLLDAVVLAICVTEDPSPSSPLMMLVLAALIDHGLRFRPRMLATSCALGLAIIAFNYTARSLHADAAIPPAAVWLSFVTTVLILYFTVFLWAVWVGTHARTSSEQVLAAALAEAAQVSAKELRRQQRRTAHDPSVSKPS